MTVPPSTSAALGSLAERIVGCVACPRLVDHRRTVSRLKRPRYADWEYWGRPVPGFGDPDARLCIIGLAPASHGGNRTGRVFTGDRTSDLLMAAMHDAGFANQPTSQHRDDGLQLHGAYITAAARCAPPHDRPTAEELTACRPFLAQELRLLPRLRAVLVLGRVGFDAYLRVLTEAGTRPGKRPAFAHGARYDMGEGEPTLFASYHPSPRNTNTGRLTAEGLSAVFASVREHLDGA